MRTKKFLAYLGFLEYVIVLNVMRLLYYPQKSIKNFVKYFFKNAIACKIYRTTKSVVKNVN